MRTSNKAVSITFKIEDANGASVVPCMQKCNFVSGSRRATVDLRVAGLGNARCW